jgi:N utilization substance protein B
MSRKRSQARSCAVQAIYQWQITGQTLTEIYDQFLSEVEVRKLEIPYFKDLLFGVPKELAALDGHLKPCLDRSIESVDPVERAILRLGAYELLHHPEVPYRVVINESVELTKTFGAEQGHRYVNGVLDKLARSLRKAETGTG